MYHPLIRFFAVLLPLMLLFCAGCKEKSHQNASSQTKSQQRTNESYGSNEPKEQYNKPLDKYHAKSKKDHKNDLRQRQQSNEVQSSVPRSVIDVLAYVRQNDKAPAGYVGGRRFGNFENHLPRKDVEGHRIEYREWDVNHKRQGRNRGTERLVTGSDGRAWYSNDHYSSFVEIN